ncbi:hypothetical protein DWY95_02465 [Faecalibacterium sp. AF28-13AC]|nr:hypothetical protein DWY95_02465 [Faecalibacterium sp. AF28-13AC]
MDSGIPTDKDQYSELDVQDQKEISDFQRQVDGRLDMLMLGSPTTYAKGWSAAPGGGAVIISVRKNTETGGPFSIKIRKLGRVGV